MEFKKFATMSFVTLEPEVESTQLSVDCRASEFFLAEIYEDLKSAGKLSGDNDKKTWIKKHRDVQSEERIKFISSIKS